MMNILPPTKEELSKRIAVAGKKIPADIVIKNARIINVYTLSITTGDIAIADGFIAAIGDDYSGHTVVNAAGKYVSPSFIDGHIHIESSTLTPSEFAKVMLPHGVTTIVTDPHEIANVLGTKGLEYMLKNSEGLPMDQYFVLPSCVPATSFEHSGAVLKAEDLSPFYHHKRVIGLAEVMDYPSVMAAEHDMMNKIAEAHAHGTTIDGHLAGLTPLEINGYLAAGIRNDHECVTPEEALNRVERGMHVLIRQGSGSKNLPALVPIVNERNSSRFSFCTDDKHLDELVEEGSINASVKQAIAQGLDPFIAYQMATLNTAQCFRMHDRGGISPGLKADLLLLSDMEQVTIEAVMKNGEWIAENGTLLSDWSYTEEGQDDCVTSVHVAPYSSDAFTIIPENKEANVIEIIPNQIVTTHKKMTVPINEKGEFLPSEQSNLQKLLVVERHHARGTIGAGIVSGLCLKENCAIASTVAHDSHNIIAAGTSDDALLLAIEKLREMQGGLVVVQDGRVTGSMPLALAGLMSTKRHEEALTDMLGVEHALEKAVTSTHFNHFLLLSFLALPVIPSIKLTDRGLFSVSEFRHITV